MYYRRSNFCPLRNTHKPEFVRALKTAKQKSSFQSHLFCLHTCKSIWEFTGQPTWLTCNLEFVNLTYSIIFETLIHYYIVAFLSQNQEKVWTNHGKNVNWSWTFSAWLLLDLAKTWASLMICPARVPTTFYFTREPDAFRPGFCLSVPLVLPAKRGEGSILLRITPYHQLPTKNS